MNTFVIVIFIALGTYKLMEIIDKIDGWKSRLSFLTFYISFNVSDTFSLSLYIYLLVYLYMDINNKIKENGKV